MVKRRELLTWEEVHRLVDHLVPQFRTEFDVMTLITRGGIIPGGLISERLNIQTVVTAAVDFPFETEREASKLLAWPQFIQFPDDGILRGKSVLLVDDVWGSGRTITAVKSRVSAAGGLPFTCVLHFNPHRSLFTQSKPDFYAAVTDAYILYPWEIDRGLDLAFLDEPD
jgi:uncharacterized protein